MKIKWYEKIVLWFIKPRIGYDYGYGYGIIYKVWRGRFYVIGECELC